MSGLEEQSKFMFYTSENGVTNIKVILGEDTVWVNQLGMAEIFDTTKQVISYHLNNIYKEAELNKFATVKEILTVQKEGNRNVQRNIEFYNLDAIISVGYRVNSNKATRFRVWATSVLKEYLVKGFVLDDDRLKQGKNLFDKDYFDELIERIREIRASERRFYQKITDIYATAIDYDTASPITKTFFATVQNKLEFAITKHTAPELIKLRASSEKPNMGLTSWKNEKKGGKILKTDVRVAKNYLEKEEI
ncbi:RhuM family protein, partial [Tenacibaculum piscium]